MLLIMTILPSIRLALTSVSALLAMLLASTAPINHTTTHVVTHAAFSTLYASMPPLIDNDRIPA